MSRRSFDGRVRQVVETVERIPFNGRKGGAVRIELLECGHRYCATHLTQGGSVQYRVCEECPDPPPQWWPEPKARGVR